MVTFPPAAAALKFTVSWLWDAKFCIVAGEFGTIGSKSTHEWPRVTTSDHGWPRVTTSDHEWLRVTTGDYGWPRMTMNDHAWDEIKTTNHRLVMIAIVILQIKRFLLIIFTITFFDFHCWCCCWFLQVILITTFSSIFTPAVVDSSVRFSSSDCWEEGLNGVNR